MAARHGDSFDHYQTANLTQKYDVVDDGTIVPAVGTCGTQALQIVQGPSTQGVIKGLTTSGAHVISEVRVKLVSGGLIPCVGRVWFGTIPIFKFTRGVDGSIVGHGNPDAAFPPISFVTQGGLIPASGWVKFGYDLLLGYTGAGGITIQIDGKEVYNAQNIYTSSDGTVWTGVSLGGPNQSTTTVLYDDWTVCDGSGLRNNAMLGNLQGQWLPATGAGANTDWSVTGTANNWDVSASNAPDPSTIFISSDTASALDTYVTADLPLIANTAIAFVQVSILAAEETAGSREVEATIRQGGTDYPSGTTIGVPTTDFQYLSTVLETNPATSGDWTLNDVNADEMAGVTLTV